MTVNKSDFILQLMKDGYTRKDATMMVGDFIKTVEDNLLAGNSVSFYGFGTFDLHYRQARSCPHFFTGERLEIKGHYVPKFTAGNRLKRIVRIWESSRQAEE